MTSILSHTLKNIATEEEWKYEYKSVLKLFKKCEIIFI